MGQGWQLDQNLLSLQEFRLRRNYSRPQSASRWNSEQDSSRLWQKRKKHENACCKKEKHILVCCLRRVGSSHKKLKNFVQRRPWALASFDVFSMLHWSMFHTDRNIGWPCETCSTVALFCCSSGRPSGAGMCWHGHLVGTEALGQKLHRPPVSFLQSHVEKHENSAPVTAAVRVLPSHIPFFFHNASCIPVVSDLKLVLFEPVCRSKHSCIYFLFGSKARWNNVAPRRVAGNKGEVEGAAGNSHGYRDTRALRRMPQTSRYSYTTPGSADWSTKEVGEGASSLETETLRHTKTWSDWRLVNLLNHGTPDL